MKNMTVRADVFVFLCPFVVAEVEVRDCRSHDGNRAADLYGREVRETDACVSLSHSPPSLSPTPRHPPFVFSAL